MTKYKTLSKLPIEMRETDKPTLYPQTMALELMEKMQDSDWAIAHCDLSIGVVDNIKNMLTILSGNRIQFEK